MEATIECFAGALGGFFYGHDPNVEILRDVALPGHHDPGLAGLQLGGDGHQLVVVTPRAPHGVVRSGADEALRPDFDSVFTSFGDLK